VSYENGSVWPHDTAFAAAGMARYGDKAGAARTIAEMIAAAAAFSDRRIPELFGGQPKRPGVSPTPYPVACVPQAWSAAATFLCVRTMLGLSVGPDGTTVTLDPLLPDGVDRTERKRKYGSEPHRRCAFGRHPDIRMVVVTDGGRAAPGVDQRVHGGEFRRQGEVGADRAGLRDSPEDQPRGRHGGRRLLRRH